MKIKNLKVKSRKELATETLCNAVQLISGWKSTTPPSEWSDWDEQVLEDLLELQKQVEGGNELDAKP